MPKRERRNCENNPLEKGCHAPDQRKSAIECIQTFFRNKNWYLGGPIPERELLTEVSVKTVLRFQFDDETFNYIHDRCLSRLTQPRDYTEPTVPWTVSFLIGLLREMNRAHIPKDFQPGMLLLYFKFCEGNEVPPPPLF